MLSFAKTTQPHVRRVTLQRRAAARPTNREASGGARCACGGTCPRCGGEAKTAATLQTKLTVNEPGDAFEQEADRVADQVMRMAEPPPSPPSGSMTEPQRLTSAVQRKCSCAGGESESEQNLLQRAASDQHRPAAAPPIVHDALRSPGQPLDAATRGFMEPRFGHDFSHVRVRTDSRAAESARAVDAEAYTVGSTIVFGNGRFLPGVAAGRRLLAHELAHVVQQGSDGPGSPGPPQLMRQADDAGSAKETEKPEPGAPSMGLEFGFRSDDPPCSQAPTGLGKVTPEIDCPTTSDDIGFLGHHFHFCLDSDVFAVPGTPTEVMKFVRDQPAQSKFKVHGFASVDGNFDNNMRLSCHRAIRVAREMMNAGVPSENIEIARRGATEQFPGGPEFNRVVVVQAVPPSDATPSGPNLPAGTREEKQAIVDHARQILREGNYKLGADAYLSFWTCGKIKRVSDAVDRMHVRFEGEPGVAKPGVEGNAEGIGTNVIALSDAVLGSANQVDCVIERLVDMAFHQMTLETLPTFGLRHKGSRFLIGLAGLDTCSIPGFSDPVPADDPLGLLEAPVCAGAPLPTRLIPTATDKKRTPPTFDGEPTYEASGARIQWQVDLSANRALIVVPALPIIARADVTAKGAAADVAQYEIGFMQTITEDETVVDYASGHRLELRVPTPIRDRDRRPSTAPWFASELNATPDDAGAASTFMFKGIVTEVPLVYEDVEKGGARQPGNVIDTTTRHIHFVNWLVARRRDAPKDRFATHFLAGKEFDFTQSVDVLGVDGKGTFDASFADTDAGSAAQMQFGGPTPEDLGGNFVTVVTNPPARADAAQVTRLEFAGMLRQMIEGLTPPRLNLKHSSLTVQVFIDAATGRVALPDPSKNFSPVVVTSPNIPSTPRRDLAAAITQRARKRDFLGQPDKPAIVKRDPRDQSQGPLDSVTIVLTPTPDPLLINRPGVKAAMREMWRRTEADEASGDPRGHSLTIYIDRNNNLRPLISNIQRGKPPVLIPQPDGSFVRIFAETCGGTATDPDNDTPLGEVHTHPNPPTPPSFKDHDSARDHQDLCGVQHFVITRDSIIQFDATTDTPLGDRTTILGP